MVVDHHQLDVFGLILDTSRCIWGLRRNNKWFCFFNVLYKQDRLIPVKYKANTEINSCLMHASRTKEKTGTINKDELCRAKTKFVFFPKSK